MGHAGLTPFVRVEEIALPQLAEQSVQLLQLEFQDDHGTGAAQPCQAGQPLSFIG